MIEPEARVVAGFRIRFWTFGAIPYELPKLFYGVFPCSGFAWLYYSSTLGGPASAPPQGK